MIAGLWCSDKKPKMQHFLKPIVNNLIELEKNGFNFTSEHSSFNCKCLTIAVSCDLPAKCMVYNTKQFNGYFGCHNCEIEGTSVKKGKGNVMVFPHADAIKAIKRTHDSYLADAQIGTTTNKPHKGIYGPSCLTKLTSLDIYKICQGDMSR